MVVVVAWVVFDLTEEKRIGYCHADGLDEEEDALAPGRYLGFSAQPFFRSLDETQLHLHDVGHEHYLARS